MKRLSVRIGLCMGLLLVAHLLIGCRAELPYRATGHVLQSYPHDDEAFTQGLVFDGSDLYESTGLYGESSLRQVDLETGSILRIRHLPDAYFAEGCTIWEDQIIQLTWKSGVAFEYDKEDFAIRGEFSYDGEGWGLTQDGQHLIMSDGTSYLRFLDPETLQETSRVQVTDQGTPVERLNELEWVRGEVWANVWQSPQVARIDVKTGQVQGWIDFTELADNEPRGVLNGIAVQGDSMFVTGKRWDALYEVEIVPADAK